MLPAAGRLVYSIPYFKVPSLSVLAFIIAPSNHEMQPLVSPLLIFAFAQVPVQNKSNHFNISCAESGRGTFIWKSYSATLGREHSPHSCPFSKTGNNKNKDNNLNFINTP